MSKKGRIPEPAKAAGRIPVPEPGKMPVTFSFKYLRTDNEKFSIDHCVELREWIDTFFDRVKGVSELTLHQFIHPVGNPRSWRSHKIDFAGTTEKTGYPILSDVWRASPWQFQLQKDELGRVHGFIAGNVFHVVWLDPAHKLYE